MILLFKTAFSSKLYVNKFIIYEQIFKMSVEIYIMERMPMGTCRNMLFFSSKVFKSRHIGVFFNYNSV